MADDHEMQPMGKKKEKKQAHDDESDDDGFRGLQGVLSFLPESLSDPRRIKASWIFMCCCCIYEPLRILFSWIFNTFGYSILFVLLVVILILEVLDYNLDVDTNDRVKTLECLVRANIELTRAGFGAAVSDVCS